MAVDLRRYLEVLRAPGVARLVLFALMGRLPFGVLPRSIVLLMRREDYDYGEIGAVLGAATVGVSITVDSIALELVFIGAIAAISFGVLRWRSRRSRRTRDRAAPSARP